jgi:hypothetical protein
MGHSPDFLEDRVQAKGDLIAGNSATTVARVAAGTNGQMLTAQSASTGGLAWAAAPVARTVQSKATTYTAVNGDIVLADATGGTFAVTLPAVAAGLIVDIKKVDASANAVTITPASGTIDGAATVALTTRYASRSMVSDGTSWFLL